MNASLQAVVDTFTAPTQAFARVRDRRASVWPPLLLVLVATGAVTTWYFMTVDAHRFMAEQMALSGQELTPEQMAAAGEQMARFLPFSGVTPVLFSLVLYALIALYLHLVATVTSEAELGYGRWFCLVSYAYLPALVGVITIAVNYGLAGDGYVSFASLDLTSLNNLILHWPLSNPWVGLVNALSLVNLWVIALLTLGYRTLTGRSMTASLVTVLVPFVLIFGGWAAVIALRG